MSNRRTHTYTRRADAMDSPESRRRRLKTLKALSRPLDVEEIAELRNLLKEFSDD